MRITERALGDVVVLEPRVFGDDRGFFKETFQAQNFDRLGLPGRFVQDNQSRSARHVLRGLHYQIEHAQGKLVRVVLGSIWDVAVDLRQGSPTYQEWFGRELSAENHLQMYIPPGFAHGFCVLSETADVIYSCTDFYHPEHERSILWNDPQLAVAWPIDRPVLSEKDAQGLTLAAAPTYASGSFVASTDLRP